MSHVSAEELERLKEAYQIALVGGMVQEDELQILQNPESDEALLRHYYAVEKRARIFQILADHEARRILKDVNIDW